MTSILNSNYQAVLSVLDQLDVGLCITHENGMVVVRNAEADFLLDSNDGIRLARDNALQCCDPECQLQFERALRNACDTSAAANTTSELVIVSDPGSQQNALFMEVAALNDAGETPVLNEQRHAIVTLIDPSQPRVLAVDRVVLSYGLTDAEAEVCKFLIEGRTTKKMAEIRSVSQETIKSQVKAVLRKTQCARRSDLIRLASAITAPLRSGD